MTTATPADSAGVSTADVAAFLAALRGDDRTIVIGADQVRAGLAAVDRRRTGGGLTTDDVRTLLAAVDANVRGGGYTTGANVALKLLCYHLGVDRNTLTFDPEWIADATAIAARAGSVVVQPDEPAVGRAAVTAAATTAGDGSKGSTGGGVIEIDADGAIR